MRRRRLRQIAPAQPCADPNQDLPITDKLTDKFPVGEIRIVQTGAVDRGLNPGARNDMRLVRRRQRLADRYRVPPAPALPRTGVLPLNIIHPVQGRTGCWKTRLGEREQDPGSTRRRQAASTRHRSRPRPSGRNHPTMRHMMSPRMRRQGWQAANPLERRLLLAMAYCDKYPDPP